MEFQFLKVLLDSHAQASEPHRRKKAETKTNIKFLFAFADSWPSKAYWHLSSVVTGALFVDYSGMLYGIKNVSKKIPGQPPRQPGQPLQDGNDERPSI